MITAADFPGLNVIALDASNGIGGFMHGNSAAKKAPVQYDVSQKKLGKARDKLSDIMDGESSQDIGEFGIEQVYEFTPEERKKIFAAAANIDKLKTFKISDLFAGQGTIDEHRVIDQLPRVNRTDERSPMIVVKYRGQKVIFDGHHRVVARDLMGIDEIKAKYVNADDLLDHDECTCGGTCAECKGLSFDASDFPGLVLNCGISEGGFQPGNTCAKGGGSGVKESKGDVPKRSADDFKFIKKLGGSTGARMVKDKESGKTVVMKAGRSKEQVHNDVAATNLMRKMGVNVAPSAELVHVDGKDYGLFEEIKGAQDIGAKDMQKSSDVQNSFAANAILSNWDAVGLDFDNIMRGADGKDYFIDAGGALNLRAMGAPKPNWFGNKSAGELDTMREMGTAGKVFGKLTDADVVKQIDRISLTKSDIRDTLTESRFGGDLDRMTSTIYGRLEAARAWADERRGVKLSADDFPGLKVALVLNCGIGEGGFLPGNACAKGGKAGAKDYSAKKEGFKDHKDKKAFEKASRRQDKREAKQAAKQSKDQPPPPPPAASGPTSLVEPPVATQWESHPDQEQLTPEQQSVQATAQDFVKQFAATGEAASKMVDAMTKDIIDKVHSILQKPERIEGTVRKWAMKFKASIDVIKNVVYASGVVAKDVTDAMDNAWAKLTGDTLKLSTDDFPGLTTALILNCGIGPDGFEPGNTCAKGGGGGGEKGSFDNPQAVPHGEGAKVELGKAYTVYDKTVVVHDHPPGLTITPTVLKQMATYGVKADLQALSPEHPNGVELAKQGFISYKYNNKPEAYGPLAKETPLSTKSEYNTKDLQEAKSIGEKAIAKGKIDPSSKPFSPKVSTNKPPNTKASEGLATPGEKNYLKTTAHLENQTVNGEKASVFMVANTSLNHHIGDRPFSDYKAAGYTHVAVTKDGGLVARTLAGKWETPKLVIGDGPNKPTFAVKTGGKPYKSQHGGTGAKFTPQSKPSAPVYKQQAEQTGLAYYQKPAPPVEGWEKTKIPERDPNHCYKERDAYVERTKYTGMQQKAVVSYTGSGYRLMNRALREDTYNPNAKSVTGVNGKITQMQNFLKNNAGACDPPGVPELYRGSSMPKHVLEQFQKAHENGDAFEFKGFASTSSKVQTAAGFGGSGSGTALIRIRGSSSVPLKSPHHSSECEYVAPLGTKYRVMGVEKWSSDKLESKYTYVGKEWLITLEEING